jgi:hypothetical protein
MDIRSLANGLTYRGHLTTNQHNHHVFEGQDYYFLLSCTLSPSRTVDGYFNILDKRAVQYVRTRFAGESGVSTMDVLARASRTRHVASNVVALNILYVLVALGQAAIERAVDHNHSLFRVSEL